MPQGLPIILITLGLIVLFLLVAFLVVFIFGKKLKVLQPDVGITVATRTAMMQTKSVMRKLPDIEPLSYLRPYNPKGLANCIFFQKEHLKCQDAAGYLLQQFVRGTKPPKEILKLMHKALKNEEPKIRRDGIRILAGYVITYGGIFLKQKVIRACNIATKDKSQLVSMTAAHALKAMSEGKIPKAWR